MKTFNEWIEGSIKYKFNQIAEFQDKSVKQIILKIHQLGVSPLSLITQNASDIVKLMNQISTWESAGYDRAKQIIDNLISVLNYDFESQLNYAIVESAKNRNLNEELLREKINDLLMEYEKEFKKMPEYNAAHSVTKIIGRKIGQKEWIMAFNKVKILESKSQSVEQWTRFAREPIKDSAFVGKKINSNFIF